MDADVGAKMSQNAEARCTKELDTIATNNDGYRRHRCDGCDRWNILS
jgi:hypothetical protein